MRRLGKLCGASNNGKVVILVEFKFKLTRCWKMGWDRNCAIDGLLLRGMWERSKWDRAVKGRFAKEKNFFSSIFKQW